MRNDISDYLIHFTKGCNEEEAYQNLKSIIESCKIFGSKDKIRDKSRCVCFTEVPLSNLQSGLLNPSLYSRYSPFGILTTKEYIFSLGGRPVIYQSESEFGELTESNSWRHMRYEPPKIDFTWEREWRLKTRAFSFNPSIIKIIVPDNRWYQRLINEHDEDQMWQTLQLSQVLDESIAIQYEERFPWLVIELSTKS